MQIIPFLHDLPSTLVYAVFMLGAGTMAGLTCLVVTPRLNLPVAKDHLDLAMRTSGTVTAALTLTLAFCAVQARSQVADAQRLVSAEVSAIGSLARTAERLGPQGHAMRAEAMRYLEAVAGTEFPRMARHGADPETQRRAEALERAVFEAAGQVAPLFATDLLQEEDQVEEARQARLDAAAAGLPTPFWTLILVLVALLIGTGLLYPPRRLNAAMLAVQAAGIGALIAFVFVMDKPFRGHQAISAEPYRHLQRSIAHRAEQPARFSAPPGQGMEAPGPQRRI
jgi:hypothetical protein